MSLLDAGPDEIVIYPEIAIVDEYSTPKRGPAAVGVPVTIKCRIGVDDQDPRVTWRYAQERAPGSPRVRITVEPRVAVGLDAVQALLDQGLVIHDG